MSLRELLDRATPGPWTRVGQRLISLTATRTVADMRYVNGVNDAALIVHLRNNAEAICDLIDAAGIEAERFPTGPIAHALAALEALDNLEKGR